MATLMRPERLWELMQQGPRPTVLDVRDVSDYEAGHVPGALHVPAADVAQRLVEIPRDRPVVAY